MIIEEEHDPYDHISFNEAFGKTLSMEEEFDKLKNFDEEMDHDLTEYLTDGDTFFERLTTD